MGRYNKPKKTRKSGRATTWKVVLLIILTVLLIIASVFAYVVGKLDLIQYDTGDTRDDYSTVPTGSDNATESTESIINTEGLEIYETAPEIVDSEIISNKDVLNILLIGTDERTKEFNVDARSDSMIIASINQKKNTVKLVSLERGIAAPILAGAYKGGYDWLTHIFRYGGADLLMETVEYMFKVDIDNYIRVNFATVTTVIDAIGGIDLEISESEQQFMEMYRSVYQSTTTQKPVVVGMNTFDGGMALGYARLRAIDDDWFRIARQRKVIIATAQKLKGSSLKELNDLANQLLPLVQTDLTKLEIADLMLYAPQLMGATFDQMTIPQPGTYGGMNCIEGRGGFAVHYDVNNPLLHEFLYGETKAE